MTTQTAVQIPTANNQADQPGDSAEGLNTKIVALEQQLKRANERKRSIMKKNKELLNENETLKKQKQMRDRQLKNLSKSQRLMRLDIESKKERIKRFQRQDDVQATNTALLIQKANEIAMKDKEIKFLQEKIIGMRTSWYPMDQVKDFMDKIKAEMKEIKSENEQLKQKLSETQSTSSNDTEESKVESSESVCEEQVPLVDEKTEQLKTLEKLLPEFYEAGDYALCAHLQSKINKMRSDIYVEKYEK